MSTPIELFVPGRLCILGEYADLSASYRFQNPAIEIGHTLVAPTNQGTHARVTKRTDRKLVIKSVVDNNIFSIDLDSQALLAQAQSGGLFSYIAGVTYHLLQEHPSIGGLEIHNYSSTLPIKKGLSSSASICVLIARAFNKAYHLKLTLEQEMDFAYRGEILTPSKCGRMDQACAYPVPVLMRFDGDKVDLQPLQVGKELNFVIVDLKKGKNTQKILSAVNTSFPFPQSEQDRRLHNFLGPINTEIVLRTRSAIEQGNIAEIGRLITLAQTHFDSCIAPKCDELAAPKLHNVLTYKPIQQFIFGGKGVGSQGDGSAQFLARGKSEQEEIMRILHKNKQLDVECYALDIPAS